MTDCLHTTNKFPVCDSCREKMKKAAQLLGSAGGIASAQNLTPEQRKKRATKAVRVRIKKHQIK